MSNSTPKHIPKQPRTLAGHLRFPWTLHQMLDDASSEVGDFESIVGWTMDGKAFCVYDKKAFEKQIMPKYFKSQKYKSFQRNLNVWGFAQVKPDENHPRCGYTHVYFIRGQQNLCGLMTRLAVKSSTSLSSTPSAARAKRESTSHKSLPQDSDAVSSDSSSEDQQSTHRVAQHSSTQHASQHESSRNTSQSTTATAPALPRTRMVLHQVSSMHAQADVHQNPYFASVIGPTTAPIATSIQHAAFPVKLHYILSQRTFLSAIEWRPHGRAFQINDAVLLTVDILPTHFGIRTFVEFVAELLTFGFVFLLDGPHAGSLYHELMIKGYPHLINHLKIPEEARRYQPSFDNDSFFAGTRAESIVSLQSIPELILRQLSQLHLLPQAPYHGSAIVTPLAQIVTSRLFRLQSRPASVMLGAGQSSLAIAANTPNSVYYAGAGSDMSRTDATMPQEAARADSRTNSSSATNLDDEASSIRSGDTKSKSEKRGETIAGYGTPLSTSSGRTSARRASVTRVNTIDTPRRRTASIDDTRIFASQESGLGDSLERIAPSTQATTLHSQHFLHQRIQQLQHHHYLNSLQMDLGAGSQLSAMHSGSMPTTFHANLARQTYPTLSVLPALAVSRTPVSVLEAAAQQAHSCQLSDRVIASNARLSMTSSSLIQWNQHELAHPAPSRTFDEVHDNEGDDDNGKKREER